MQITIYLHLLIIPNKVYGYFFYFPGHLHETFVCFIGLDSLKKTKGRKREINKNSSIYLSSHQIKKLLHS